MYTFVQGGYFPYFRKPVLRKNYREMFWWWRALNTEQKFLLRCAEWAGPAPSQGGTLCLRTVPTNVHQIPTMGQVLLWTLYRFSPAWSSQDPQGEVQMGRLGQRKVKKCSQGHKTSESRARMGTQSSHHQARPSGQGRCPHDSFISHSNKQKQMRMAGRSPAHHLGPHKTLPVNAQWKGLLHFPGTKSRLARSEQHRLAELKVHTV